MSTLPYFNLRYAIFFTLAFCVSYQSAQATFPLGCHHPIEIEVDQVENMCDGTVRAQYSYNNPNVCAFEFLGFCIIPCADKFLPVGVDVLGDGGILSVNIMYPGPIDQGQPELFLAGGSESFDVYMPANAEPITWKLWHNPLLNPPQYATADPEDAAQDCPVVPSVECMEAIDGDMYSANFTVQNFNTQETCIEPGSGHDGVNRFTGGIGADQGQPECFPAWPAQETFTLEWDGSGTRWRIEPEDCSGPECNQFAPSDGNIDLAFYDESVEIEVCPSDPTIAPIDCPVPTEFYSTYVNRCESFPINPILDCTYDNGDGTVTSYYGYKSYQSETQSVGIDSWIPGITPSWSTGGGNMVLPNNPLVALDLFDVVGQPEEFDPGLHQAVMNVTWDTAETEEIYWVLYLNEWNHLSSAEAYASTASISKQCQPVAPLTCLELDPVGGGNEAGEITARFGYTNSNGFEITVNPAVITLKDQGGNDVTPDTGTVPNQFQAGGVDPVTAPSFEVVFDDTDSVSWSVAGTQREAGINTAELCQPGDYEAPSCDIQGSTDLTCGGDQTATTLVALGEARGSALGRAVTYTWNVNCGEDGVDSTFEISGDDGELLELTSILPGMGEAIASGSCAVTLGVSDGISTGTCTTEITAEACELDCADEPFVDGATPNNLVDECGICYPTGDPLFNTTCADCLGTPNGDADTDEFGSCCLPGELDQCDVCNGNNDTCLECIESDISTTQFELDGQSEELSRLVGKASRMLRRESRRYSGIQRNRMRRVARRIRSNALEVQESNWAAIWSVPSVVQNCGNEELCLSVSNAPVLGQVDENLDQLQKLVRRGVRRLRRSTGNVRIGGRLLRRAVIARFSAETQMNQFPLEVSQCGVDQVTT